MCVCSHKRPRMKPTPNTVESSTGVLRRDDQVTRAPTNMTGLPQKRGPKELVSPFTMGGYNGKALSGREAPDPTGAAWFFQPPNWKTNIRSF